VSPDDSSDFVAGAEVSMSMSPLGTAPPLSGGGSLTHIHLETDEDATLACTRFLLHPMYEKLMDTDASHVLHKGDPVALFNRDASLYMSVAANPATNVLGVSTSRTKVDAARFAFNVFDEAAASHPNDYHLRYGDAISLVHVEDELS